jgi:hypothetical protein
MQTFTDHFLCRASVTVGVMSTKPINFNVLTWPIPSRFPVTYLTFQVLPNSNLVET